MSTPNRMVVIDDTSYETEIPQKFERRKGYVPKNPKQVLGHIPGLIVSLHVKHGQKVKMGDSLMILEAMKMQNDVTAPMDGTVKVVLVSEGQKTRKDQVLLEFE